MIYGSYQLSNAWPDRLSAEQNVYLDQLTGRTLARSDASSFGAIGQVTELGVLTHMGTQFGVVNRIVMTAGVLLLLTSISTSAVIVVDPPTQRPRRPVAAPDEPQTAVGDGGDRFGGRRGLPALGLPALGVWALIVILIDRFVIRRVGRLRSIFGLPPRQEKRRPA